MRHPARVTSHYCYDTRATLRRLATVWRRIDTSNYLHECMKEYRDVLRMYGNALCVVTTVTVEQFGRRYTSKFMMLREESVQTQISTGVYKCGMG